VDFVAKAGRQVDYENFNQKLTDTKWKDWKTPVVVTVRSRSPRKVLAVLERTLLSLFISHAELLSRDGKRSANRTYKLSSKLRSCPSDSSVPELLPELLRVLLAF
jgi:hypothetical protein